jgi:MFS transporter, FSR family, fosmidomycin resistance protein
MQEKKIMSEYYLQKTAGFQWTQLLVLTAIHIIVDMYTGMLPAVLPAVRDNFVLSLTAAVTILTVLNLAANIFQVLVGHLRPHNRTPFFLPLGLFFAAAICLLALIKDLSAAYYLALVLALLSGFGIAVAHPESLRAVYSLDRISPSVITAVFLTGGFVGFAGSGWAATALVDYFGLKGLYLFLFPPILAVSAIYFFKFRLVVEPKIKPDLTENRIPFWDIFFMAVPLTLSSTVLISLLPTFLHDSGFELTFGGFSTMLFGLGGAAGSFVFAVAAHKKGELKTAIWILLAGTVLVEVYWLLVHHHAAVWILFFGGFCVVSAYPLIVTMARHAHGLNLGQRMAIIVGGAWGPPNAALILFGWVAEHFGIHWILRFVFMGYLISAIIGVYILKKFARKASLAEPKNEIFAQ